MAVVVACLGTIGLGLSSAADAPSDDSHQAVSFWRMFVVLVATGWVVLEKMSGIRERIGNKSKKMSAAMFGLQAGGMFGLSASTVRAAVLLR